ncbi:hypothetical protein, partial [Komagataeibacter saccharivorans]|uniref:hypothetical protein n=1 Tax=Komagataeibacter saccharivorans TaxID=265959 RepID=UPI0024A8FBA9
LKKFPSAPPVKGDIGPTGHTVNQKNDIEAEKTFSNIDTNGEHWPRTALFHFKKFHCLRCGRLPGITACCGSLTLGINPIRSRQAHDARFWDIPDLIPQRIVTTGFHAEPIEQTFPRHLCE